MSDLIPPHGGKPKPLLLKGDAWKEALDKAKTLQKIRMTTRERDDLIMMGDRGLQPSRRVHGKG